MFKIWNGNFWKFLTLCLLIIPTICAIPHLQCTITGIEGDLKFVNTSDQKTTLEINNNSFMYVQEIKVMRANGKNLCKVNVSIAYNGKVRELAPIYADGVIVALPLASTGASRGAGGAYVHPGVEAILFTTGCAHVISSRQVFLHKNTKITITWDKADIHTILVNGSVMINYNTKADKLVMTVEYGRDETTLSVALPLIANIFEGVLQPFLSFAAASVNKVYINWFNDLRTNYFWNGAL